MNIVLRIIASYRLARWKKKLKSDKGFTVRIKQPKVFIKRLEALGVPYVVLRWYCNLPTVLAGDAGNEDIDILVAHGYMLYIAAAVPIFNFGKKSNKVRFDIYSDSGRSGLSYRKMPYYPPVRAWQILATRVKDERGWYKIAPAIYLQALVYHLTYHKGPGFGLPIVSGEPTSVIPKKDYSKYLQDEAEAYSIGVPKFDSLITAHQWLCNEGWSIPFDLIQRWSEQNDWMQYLYNYNLSLIKESSYYRNLGGKSVVFVLRSETHIFNCKEFILDKLRDSSDEIEFFELDDACKNNLMWWTRGGNWLDYKTYALSRPLLLVKCELKSDAVNLKEELRKSLSEKYGKKNWLHSSDDIYEAAYNLMVLDDDRFNIPVYNLEVIEDAK